MKYRIVISPQAFDDLQAFIEYIAVEQNSPMAAARWFDKAWTSVQSLANFPYRCPLAPESKLSKYQIRMLIVDSCLFLYRVEDEKNTVRILGFRHGRQVPLEL
jgi:toxin ParE1/3/4